MKALGANLNSRWLSECWTLVKVSEKYHKGYCVIPQKRILELLKLYHNVVIARSTLNRDFRWLEDSGFIRRKSRTVRGKNGKPVYRPTLYVLEGKLFNFLYLWGRRLRNIFCFFRVPKWVHYQGLTSLESKEKSSGGVGILWINQPDGSWEPKLLGKTPPLKV